MRVKLVILSLAIFATLLLGGCSLLFMDEGDAPKGTVRGKLVKIEATGYCACGKCCGWKRNWLGRPVIKSGRNRGKPKAVGITASGKKAKPGTVAADSRYYPMGTVFYIPGYGYGVVEDRGGDIKGRKRLDLYFSSHSQALKWGRKKLTAVVFPQGTPPVKKNAPPPR
jgi:3D (Asp-Asp-Asp) domain-containing protein